MEESLSSENDEDTSRSENLLWCVCDKCVFIPTVVETKCCRECIGNKLEGLKCISTCKDFDLCLNKTIIDAVEHESTFF